MIATSELRPKAIIPYVYASYGGDLYTSQVKANSGATICIRIVAGCQVRIVRQTFIYSD
jgi:hypothetical protein